MAAGQRLNGQSRVLNCVPSKDPQNDWTLDKALAEGLVSWTYPERCDLRRPWWNVGDQLTTSSCVGWAATDGVLRWHLAERGLIRPQDELSPWLTWMAAKETDADPESTVADDHSGVTLKAALDVLRKYGAVHASEFPFDHEQFRAKYPSPEFAELAAKLRIKAYYRVMNDNNCDPNHLRMWIARQGPVLALVDVDSQWVRESEHVFEEHGEETGGGHAVAIVGYTQTHFVIRNSWGTDFCDQGYVLCSNAYVQSAVCEAYGVVV